MKLPTISLALIAKNEEKNVKRLLDSVEGCFDEIIFVDTGSTDRTKELALEMGCKVFDFEWVNSFSKARNFAFSHASCDYVMWMDLDDVLSNKDGFLKWKNYAMSFADVWFATYNYALDKNGTPIVKFVRERVFRNSLKPAWQYDIHEGVVCKPEWSKDYAVAWTVNHMRDAEDIKADKSRNVRILEEIKKAGKFDARLKFYYGKELYESGQANEALSAFDEALADQRLEPHDRLLSYQYAGYAAIQCADQIKDEHMSWKQQYFEKALEYYHAGMKLDPNRAEFHVGIGDVHLKRQDLIKAIPYYAAAKQCFNASETGSPYEGAIYSFVDCYGQNPMIQLAKIYFHLGKIKEAKREALVCWKKFGNLEAKQILEEIKRIKSLTTLENGQAQTEDIVFTCPPVSAYEFDEELYKVKGMGGSETALIEVAKALKKFTGRNVKVFAMREKDLLASSGVEYLSNRHVNEYMSKFKPRVHIAWRHNIKVTTATTYLWCHDLVTPTVEFQQNFDQIMCLTPFHKNYVMGKQNVPAEKITVTRNGITPEKFKFKMKEKNPNKLVWMSSPDRGLDRAMLVCDEVRKDFPHIELHVYYGLDNLYKYGLSELADRLKAMMAERPWVKYHGFTEQSKMYEEVSDAVVWCHPCNFIETFCITALEMLALKIFPVTRSLGALADTLKSAQEAGHAILLDHDCVTHEQIQSYKNAICSVLTNRRWEDIEFNPDDHSWEMVTKEWIEFMGITSIPSLPKGRVVVNDELGQVIPIKRNLGEMIEHSPA